MACVTLLSDFGTIDASVAVAKGVIMQYAPDAKVIDISHALDFRHVHQAGYMLRVSYKHFPIGSCHLLLFGVMQEAHQRLMLAEHDGHYFLVPDTGVLNLALGNEVDLVWECYHMKAKEGFGTWLHECAKAISQLQVHEPKALQYLESQLKQPRISWQPIVTSSGLDCHIIHIDNFQNVVLNLTESEFDKHRGGRKFLIQFVRRDTIDQISKHYHDVQEGMKLCRFNSAGYMEIAVNCGKAASLFGLKLQQAHHMLYNTIHIEFENDNPLS